MDAIIRVTIGPIAVNFEADIVAVLVYPARNIAVLKESGLS